MNDRFKKWSLVELKLYLQDLQSLVDKNKATDDDKEMLKQVKKEIEKRTNK